MKYDKNSPQGVPSRSYPDATSTILTTSWHRWCATFCTANENTQKNSTLKGGMRNSKNASPTMSR